MNEQASNGPVSGVYDRKLCDLIAAGSSKFDASLLVTHDYLDGKPALKGKRKLTSLERNQLFWNSSFLGSLPPEAWLHEPMVLALARYLEQEAVSNPTTLSAAARLAPSSVIRAARYSGIVLRPHSARRKEIDRLAAWLGGDLAELTRILDIFDDAHQVRRHALNTARARISSLSPLETLAYASLYAFDQLIPSGYPTFDQAQLAKTSAAWDAINDLLIWKLSTTSENKLRLTDEMLGQSLATHLSPFLFPVLGGPPPRTDLLGAVYDVMAAQLELNAFLAQSADAFSYDDSITFVRTDSALTIVELDPALRSAWSRDGHKLARLRTYWLRRGLEAFALSPYAIELIGRPENHSANQVAFIQAMAVELRLREVHGVDEVITTDAGDQVALFTCLLSMELMSASFNLLFLMPYQKSFKESGSSIRALGILALNGLARNGEIRFPLTWSDRAEKIARIKGWTVTPEAPKGSERTAAAVLDFWSSDWIALADRLRNGDKGIRPHLFERPVLKLGRYLLQLPWMVATQDNHAAAINNLRRLGARRKEASNETRRIELGLARHFQSRGFITVANWLPMEPENPSVGEIDLICAMNGFVLIVEVKSTYLRRTVRDAWVHSVTALRSAGRQLSRKVAYVKATLSRSDDLAGKLGLAEGTRPPIVLGWIIDTSIEQDHRRFSGFLKVSFEEVMIALRDDSDFLDSPVGTSEEIRSASSGDGTTQRGAARTLYPDGFGAQRFVEVVERMLVWEA